MENRRKQNEEEMSRKMNEGENFIRAREEELKRQAEAKVAETVHIMELKIADRERQFSEEKESAIRQTMDAMKAGEVYPLTSMKLATADNSLTPQSKRKLYWSYVGS